MLTPEELLEKLPEYDSQRQMARALSIPESTLRRKLGHARRARKTEPLPDHAFKPTEEQMPDTHVGNDGVKTEDLSSDTGISRYIFTSAQNNTAVHQGFFNNLKAFTDFLGARLVVSFNIYDKAGYRGPVVKGERQRLRRELWWDKAVQPYVVNHRLKLAKRIAFCGELDILATAKRPLSGMESYCRRSSILVPHNRFQFHCVEARSQHMPKEMHTTGACTTRNFIQRKTGQLAAFHHILGALLVEVDNATGYFHVHHLNADDDGSFYWIDKRIADEKVYHNNDGIEALVLGDIHHEKLDSRESRIAGKILGILEPKHVLIHDLIDFRSRNHHNRDNPLFRVSVANVKVEEELQRAANWLANLYRRSPRSAYHVVRSNHDEALDRWIREADWKKDPVNAAFYLELAHQAVVNAQAGLRFNSLEWAIEREFMNGSHLLPINFLRSDESLEIAGVECGIHGHIGPSGARGNPRGYSKLGFKTFTAHLHTPSIVDGCYTVGVLGKLDMDYNRGPSKWMHAHGIVYPNGKRAFLFSKNGHWRLPLKGGA